MREGICVCVIQTIENVQSSPVTVADIRHNPSEPQNISSHVNTLQNDFQSSSNYVASDSNRCPDLLLIAYLSLVPSSNNTWGLSSKSWYL
jgi:hypothetical protein